MGSNEAERYSMYPEEGKKEYATKFDSTDGKDKKKYVSHQTLKDCLTTEATNLG